MIKRFSLFIYLVVLMAMYSVTANALVFEEASEEPVLQIPIASAPIIQSDQADTDSKRVDTIFEMELLPFETIILESDDLPVGERIVVSEGSEGELLIVKRIITAEDGSSTEVASERVVTEPSNEIIHVGTGENIIKTDEGYFKYSARLDMRATAYCLCKACTGKVPGQKGYGITASGIPARYGVVAVDPRVIPLGTKLYIEGYGHAIAGDTGGGVKGNIIDLFFNDSNIVKKFGIQNRTVYVLTE